MFFAGSRYQDAGTYTVETSRGPVLVTRIPLPRRDVGLRGFHRRLEGQRLDLVANFHLKDPTAGWRLCEASGTIAPDALAARELIAVPASEK